MNRFQNEFQTYAVYIEILSQDRIYASILVKMRPGHKFSPETIPNPYQWKNPNQINIFSGKYHMYCIHVPAIWLWRG